MRHDGPPVPKRRELKQAVKEKCLDSAALEAHFAEPSKLGQTVRWFAGVGTKRIAVNLSEDNILLIFERLMYDICKGKLLTREIVDTTVERLLNTNSITPILSWEGISWP